jgi:nucleoid-associated protein YgaU
MQRDLKIGMVVGAILVIVAAIWLSTRPSLTSETARPRSHNTAPLQQTSSQPPRFEMNLPNSATYEQTEKIETQKFHIVRPGETLSAISVKYYGSASKMRKILDANPRTLENPNSLKPGMKLMIPD